MPLFRKANRKYRATDLRRTLLTEVRTTAIERRWRLRFSRARRQAHRDGSHGPNKIALTERRRRLVFVPNIARASDCGSPINRVRTFAKRPPSRGDLPVTATSGRFSRYRQRAFELLPRRQLSAALEAEESLLPDRRKAWSTRRCAHLGIRARHDALAAVPC
jgi:hypothetical protein